MLFSAPNEVEEGEQADAAAEEGVDELGDGGGDEGAAGEDGDVSDHPEPL